MTGNNEPLARTIINKQLEAVGWNVSDPNQVEHEHILSNGKKQH